MRALTGKGFLADAVNPNRAWLMDYIPDDDRAMVRRKIDAGIHAKTPIIFEHRVRRADGSLAWIATKGVPALDAEGNITEWFGTAADITARKQAEQRLRDSEARLALAPIRFRSASVCSIRKAVSRTRTRS